ncbi:SGNH/GDSL hydrolase family protein [Streptomyces sp. DSM 44915]|uniref:SGNH/GDSL hydrolase family protein n=1 Tax=Streptomyces chisholmiae TaxID=3075540 RepID=A0ABU2JSH9_9ACTN|nr:SGNH/GDSL hydrolase family protein [Streptomyces sp. DSM 44915]MDT0267948.1 SGNH/GDSL hydrolase family protein [Streptomyces sp. DSM 44915]
MDRSVLTQPTRPSRRLLSLTALFALVCAVLLTLTTAPARAAEAPAEPAAEPTRIMALGDSITGSPGCWRALLWQDLDTAGYADNVDFVGSRSPDGCGFPFDGEHEGHGGILTTGIVRDNQLPGWLASADPDVVMMTLGTNDVWSAVPTTTLLDAYSTLVGQMRDANPDVRVLVAQILPMTPAGCAECYDRVVDLNAAIPDWAAGLSTPESPLTVVDLWTGFDTATDTGDGVHPNEAGWRKMADAWYPALTGVLDDLPTAD